MAEQPDWANTVAAFEVRTSREKDRDDLLAILTDVAASQGHHVDATSDQDLRQLASVYEQSFHACAWKGEEDDETLGCAMDFEDRLGFVWLTFNEGSDPAVNDAFRTVVLQRLTARFGPLPSIPIMPNGSLPLPDQVILTDGNYVVTDETLQDYELDAIRAKEANHR